MFSVLRGTPLLRGRFEAALVRGRDAETAGPRRGGATRAAAPRPAAAGDGGRGGCERRAGRRRGVAVGGGLASSAASDGGRGVGGRGRRGQRQLAPRLQVLDPADRPLHRASAGLDCVAGTF